MKIITIFAILSGILILGYFFLVKKKLIEKFEEETDQVDEDQVDEDQVDEEQGDEDVVDEPGPILFGLIKG